MLSTAEAGIVRRDPALSGLGLVLDPEALTERLNHVFAEAAVESARLLSVRYRPHLDCLSLFEIRASGSTFLLCAKAYLSEDIEKFRSPRIRRAMPGVFGPGRVVLNQPAVVLFFFPNDHQIRTLPQILGGPLSRIFPSHGAEDARLEDFDYHPETRFAARVVAAGKPNATLRAYPPARFQSVLHTSTILVDGKTLRVEPLLGVSPLCNTLLYGLPKEESLTARIVSGKVKRSDSTLVAEALAELHAQKGQGLESWDYKSELEEAAGVVAQLCPNLAERSRSTVAVLKERLDGIPCDRPAHGNFVPEHVFPGKKSVFLACLDRAVMAPGGFDLGMCFSFLERKTIYGSTFARHARAFFAAVAREYKNMTGMAGEQEKLLTAFDLYKNLSQPFSLRLNGWSEITGLLLARIEQYLSDDGASAIVVPPAREDSSGISLALRNTMGKMTSRMKGVKVSDPYSVVSDASFSFLEKALNPAEVSSRFLQSFPEIFPGAGHRLTEIRVTGYKPARECRIEYEWGGASASETGPLVLLGHVESPTWNAAAFRMLKNLWEGPFRAGSEDGITIPRPVGILSEFQMWLQYRVSGFCSSDLMLGNDGPIVAERMAQAIYKLHSCAESATRLFTMDEYLGQLRDHLSGAARIKPQYASRLERILDGCLKLASATPELQPCLVHGNLGPDDALVDRSDLYLLNLDSACQGNRALNLGSMLGGMKELALRTMGDPDGLLSCEEAFREKYLELSGKPLRQPIKTYTTLNLADQIYQSTLSAERSLFTPLLMDVCERRLDISSLSSSSVPRAVFKVR